jgi:hypothetical protein
MMRLSAVLSAVLALAACGEPASSPVAPEVPGEHETGPVSETRCTSTGSRGQCFVTLPPDETDVLVPGISFDGLIASWNADTPPGAYVEVFARVRVAGAWSDEFVMGVWANEAWTDETGASIERHSVEGQRNAWGVVHTDTLVLTDPADAARLRVARHGGATVSRLAIAVALTGADDDGGDARDDGGGLAWGALVDVPSRSQFAFDEGQAWCSPTSTSMVLGAHARALGEPDVDASVPEAAAGTWDAVYEGNGNWPFNTAFAHTRGLVAEVGWFGAMAQLEPWLAAGVPVVVSARWGPGQLPDAYISETSGHLLVIRGFNEAGDVLVNDPAAPLAEVSRTYDRQHLRDAWMRGSGGVAYLMWVGERPLF